MRPPQGTPALGAKRSRGRKLALAVALLFRHDVDEVDLHPRADAVVRGDGVPIIPLPVGEAAAAGLRVLRFIAATTRAHLNPSLRRISCSRARETDAPRGTLESAGFQGHGRRARARHARRDDLGLGFHRDQLRPARAFQTQRGFWLRRAPVGRVFIWLIIDYGDEREVIFSCICCQ